LIHRPADRGRERGGDVVDRRHPQFLDDRVDVREVAIDGADADVGVLGEGGRGGTRRRALREQLVCRREQMLAHFAAALLSRRLPYASTWGVSVLTGAHRK